MITSGVTCQVSCQLHGPAELCTSHMVEQEYHPILHTLGLYNCGGADCWPAQSASGMHDLLLCFWATCECPTAAVAGPRRPWRPSISPTGTAIADATTVQGVVVFLLSYLVGLTRCVSGLVALRAATWQV